MTESLRGCSRCWQGRPNHLTARAAGAELFDTLMVGTMMAGCLASFAWLLTRIGV